METVKTFFNNASKETAEEREPYTQEGASTQTSTPSQDTTTSAKTQSSSADVNTQQTQAKTGAVTSDTTVDRETVSEAPVVHERVHKTVVNVNQTVKDRDHHVDHYKKKIQPIIQKEDVGVTDESSHVTEQERNINRNKDSNTKEAIAAQDAKVKSTQSEDVTHESVQKDDIINDKVHHHVHERVQPVIEKDVYQKEVRHNTKDVHENIQEKDVVEETEQLEPIVDKK